MAVAFRPWKCCKRVFECPPAVLSTTIGMTPSTTTTRAVTCACQLPDIISGRASYKAACCIGERPRQAHCLVSAMLVVKLRATQVEALTGRDGNITMGARLVLLRLACEQRQQQHAVNPVTARACNSQKGCCIQSQARN